MPKVNPPLYSLNGGEVGSEALARLDLERMQFAGSLYENVLPRIVGAMTLRPGLEYVAPAAFGYVRPLEYNYSLGNQVLPILSANEMRILVDGEYVSRAAVSTAVANGDFGSFFGWTDESTGGTASVAGGQLNLNGAEFNRAIAQQNLIFVGADQGVEHGLRIKVDRGPVTVSLGTTAGAEDVLLAILNDGDHSLAFTPNAANLFLRIYTENNRLAIVDSCEIDAAGELVLETPYQTADLSSIKYKQSIDIIYLASQGLQQREIIRRSNTSWSIQRYSVNDGPFALYGGQISMNPSVFTGNGTLTSSLPYFEASMVGRLFRLTQTGQTVNTDFDGDNQQGEFVRISGVGSARLIRYTIAGTFVGRWSLQIATDNGSGTPIGWATIDSGTTPGTAPHIDQDDNVIKFFRFVVEPGDYTSGTIETSITYERGSQDGTCRILSVDSSTVAQMEVLERFFSLDPTQEWDFSLWSDYDGWPTTVETFAGRLYWGKVDKMFGSVPDNFNGFSDQVEGDSAPIIRSLNSGGHRGGLWTLAVQRLLVGTDVSEVSVRSSAFDEPLTAANWYPLDASTHGCSDVRAVKSDTDGIYIAGDGVSIHRMNWNTSSQDYISGDLTALHEEICDGSPVIAMAIQRKPDTIVWIILEDGTCRALTYEPSENVVAWSRVKTDGLFKDVVSTRSSPQDNVLFVIERNGSQGIERLADFRDCRGGQINCLADSYARFEGAATSFSVPHLDGRDVTVWADGAAVHDQGNLYTVTGGSVTLTSPASNVVIGLPYMGKYRSTKLAYGAALGTAMMQLKRVSGLGIYFVKTILDGVKVGRDFDNLFSFTCTKDDAPLIEGELQDEFDGQMSQFGGSWSTDSRICIEMNSPYPATAAGLVMQLKTNDRA